MTARPTQEAPEELSSTERRNQPLCQCVKEALAAYFSRLDGHAPGPLYDLVIAEVERPLFEVVLARTGGNLTQAAKLLGLNRTTLRARLKKYRLLQ